MLTTVNLRPLMLHRNFRTFNSRRRAMLLTRVSRHTRRQHVTHQLQRPHSRIPVGFRHIRFRVTRVHRQAQPQTRIVRHCTRPRVTRRTRLLTNFIEIRRRYIFNRFSFSLPQLRIVPFRNLPRLHSRIQRTGLHTTRASTRRRVLNGRNFPNFTLLNTTIVGPTTRATSRPDLFRRQWGRPQQRVTGAQILPTRRNFGTTRLATVGHRLQLVGRVRVTIFSNHTRTLFRRRAQTHTTIRFVVMGTVLLPPNTLNFVRHSIKHTRRAIRIQTTVQMNNSTSANTRNSIRTLGLLAGKRALSRLFDGLHHLLKRFRVRRHNRLVTARTHRGIRQSRTHLRLFKRPARRTITNVITRKVISPFRTVRIRMRRRPHTIKPLTTRRRIVRDLIGATTVRRPNRQINRHLGFRLLVRVPRRQRIRRHRRRHILFKQRQHTKRHRQRLLTQHHTRRHVIRARNFTTHMSSVGIKVNPRQGIQFLRRVRGLPPLRLHRHDVRRPQRHQINGAGRTIFTCRRGTLNNIIRRQNIRNTDRLRVITRTLRHTTVTLVLGRNLSFQFRSLQIRQFRRMVRHTANMALSRNILKLLINNRRGSQHRTHTLATTRRTYSFGAIRTKRLRVRRRRISVIFRRRARHLRAQNNNRSLPVLTLRRYTRTSRIFEMVVGSWGSETAVA